MNEILLLDDLKFEIRRSKRRKTLGLTVDRGGELVVHAPVTASKAELERWVQRKLLWVHQKIALKKEMEGSSHQPEFVSGETISYLGRNYRLKLVDNQNKPLRFNGHWFYLRKTDRPYAPSHFRKWYLETGTPWLRRRVGSWEPKAGATPSLISLRDLGFKWGSCGKNRNLFFNWRLLQLPLRLVDYVIVHELVHLLERNHTPEFRRIMDRVLPDWRERKAELELGWKQYSAFRT